MRGDLDERACVWNKANRVLSSARVYREWATCRWYVPGSSVVAIGGFMSRAPGKPGGADPAFADVHGADQPHDAAAGIRDVLRTTVKDV